MLTFAVIKTGGKQYVVSPGKRLKIEKLDAGDGAKISFEEVLAAWTDEDIKIGTPLLKGAKVDALVLKQGRGRKVIVFKYKPKARYRKKQGHRQPFTEVEIKDIKI